MSSGQTSLEQMLGVYKWVVDDVLKNVREDFLNEGVDTQVLEDLKQLWESKLVQSGALSRPVKNVVDHHSSKDQTSEKQKAQQQQQQQSRAHQPALPAPPSSSASVIQQAPPRLSSQQTTPSTSGSTPQLTLPPPLIDATQLTLPQAKSHSTTTGTHSQTQSQTTPSQTQTQVLTGTGTQPVIDVAALAQQQAVLYSAMTGGAAGIQPLMIPNAPISLIQHGGIPYAAVPTATGIQYVPITLNLQQLSAQQQQKQQTTQQSQESSNRRNIPQSDGPLPLPTVTPTNLSLLNDKDRCQHKSIPQLDGPQDGSSSEESEESSDSDADDLEDEGGGDEDPLNSNDDAESDEEEDVWGTDNTIVCQFEKVYRVRAKWKFALKDGIMHLKGYDYIFTKTNGEADW